MSQCTIRKEKLPSKDVGDEFLTFPSEGRWPGGRAVKEKSGWREIATECTGLPVAAV